MVIIYPTLIQPLFNKLSPLAEGELRTRIEALAARLKFPLKHLYEIDGSKRSSHSNAYFYGLPWVGSRCVICLGALLTRDVAEQTHRHLRHADSAEQAWRSRSCPRCVLLPEPLFCLAHLFGTVAHELGHWYYFHPTKMMIVSQLHLFSILAVFPAFLHAPPVLHAFDFPKHVAAQPPTIVAFLLYQVRPHIYAYLL